MNHPTIQLYSYHKWANRRVFERLKELPSEVYDREIKSVFSSIQQVIIHIYQTDGMWLSVMSGDEFSQTMKIIKQQQEKSAGKNLREMEELYKEINRQYESFLNRHALDEQMAISHPKYGELETTVTQMVKHVVNHGTYHRGNITAMLRQQGHAGVPTDYIFFLYDQS
jgi:uncharacterized damage-inducible protein DinB